MTNLITRTLLRRPRSKRRRATAIACAAALIACAYLAPYFASAGDAGNSGAGVASGGAPSAQAPTATATPPEPSERLPPAQSAQQAPPDQPAQPTPSPQPADAAVQAPAAPPAAHSEEIDNAAVGALPTSPELPPEAPAPEKAAPMDDVPLPPVDDRSLVPLPPHRPQVERAPRAPRELSFSARLRLLGRDIARALARGARSTDQSNTAAAPKVATLGPIASARRPIRTAPAKPCARGRSCRWTPS